MVADPNQPNIPDESPRPRIRWGNFALQAAILCLVTWGMWGTVKQASVKLSEQNVSIWKMHYGWLAVAGLFYLAGLFPSSVFWHRVMIALQQKVPLWHAIAAHYVSQLGKYVPGKFMVLVVRYSMVSRFQVGRTLTITAIFVETLTLMSVGAVLGALMLPLSVDIDWRLMTFAVLAAAVVGAPTLPPVFLRVVKWTKLHRLHPEIDQYLAGLNWHILWPGWIALAFGWVSMGLSLWAVIKALPGVQLKTELPGDLPIYVAIVALSTVTGFVSGLPAGIGPRDWVVMLLLKPHFGDSVAVLSTIVHRVLMLVAELIVAGIVFVISRFQSRG